MKGITLGVNPKMGKVWPTRGTWAVDEPVTEAMRNLALGEQVGGDLD